MGEKRIPRIVSELFTATLAFAVGACLASFVWSEIIDVRVSNVHQQAIDHGYMQHHPETGNLEWIESNAVSDDRK